MRGRGKEDEESKGNGTIKFDTLGARLTAYISALAVE